MIPGREHTYLECRCDSGDHVVRWTLDVGEGYEPNFYVEVHLTQWRGFLKRCWVALKYIFNFTAQCGHYDVTMLCIEDLATMRVALDDFEDAYERYEKDLEKKETP